MSKTPANPSIFIRSGELVTILNRIERLFEKARTLKAKLLISYLLISIVPLLFFANTIKNNMETYFVEKASPTLKNKANRLATNPSMRNYLLNPNDKGLLSVISGEIEDISMEEGFRIIVVDTQAYVLHDSSNAELGNILLYPEIMDALQKKDVSRLSMDKEFMKTAVSILDENKLVLGAVYIVSSFGEKALLDTITQSMLQLTFLLSLVILIFVVFASQLLLDPLKNILIVVKKMTDGHLNQRIAVTGHDEFAELSVSFNDMTNKLEQVETTRQEFVSNVSHELKTPLSSMKVLGESLLLQEDVPNEMYKEFLQDIISEVDRMANIINELLTLVKLDRTEPDLNIRQVNVNKVIEDIIKRQTPLATQKKIELVFEEVKNVMISADEMKLSLAISNLVENAIKYTPDQGHVKVIVDSDHQNAFITVADNGIGISEEEHAKVFARFYRVDKTRDRETGGTGLGLAITHKIVLLHNGSIKITSKENEGATFVVRFPMHHSQG